MQIKKRFKKTSFILVLLISIIILSSCSNVDTTVVQGEFTDMKYYRRGASDPIVIMEEYSDFFCPHCATSQAVIDLILEEYPDKVALEYHHYSFMGSSDIHVANECAGEQNKFWEFHELAWENQYDLRMGDKKDIVNLAVEAGVSKDQFEQCFVSDKYENLVDQSRVYGKEKYGINATPTFVINGRVVEMTDKGLYETLKEAIEKAFNSPLA